MFQLAETDIVYTIRRYKRSKYLRISIGRGGVVTVTGPKRVALRHFHAFVIERQAWIMTQVNAVQTDKHPDLIRTDREHFEQHRAAALALVEQKVQQWNQYYGFDYGRVTVKQLSSRWGSCSSKGNLNFSYRILFLPEALQDYLVVHELCHLREMNHSPKFWQLVAETIPEYSVYKKEFKKL